MIRGPVTWCAQEQLSWRLTPFTMTSDRPPLSLRVAAFLFVIEGAWGLIVSALDYFRPAGSEPMLGFASQIGAIVNILGCLLTLGVGVGIIYRRPFWRALGAWTIGLWCGNYLAYFVTGYWSLGPTAWSSQLFVPLLFLAFGGWQLWAVTNPTARLYIQKGSQRPQSLFHPPS